MKRFSKMRIITLIIALLAGAIPAAATERPFALNGSGVASFITDEAGHVIGANPTASGTATHLGVWSTTGTVHYAPPDENGRIPSSGDATITTANGDKLYVVLQGSFDPNAFTDHGSFTFVGGTGRFAEVSGTADFVVTVNPITSSFELTVVGTINY